MTKNKNSKTSRNRLLIVLGSVGIIVASFFIYKYVYIYTERKKYDAATIAIQKVASDLRAQGIETEFTKGCGQNIQIYSSGPTNCSVSLNFKSNQVQKMEAKNIINIFEESLDKNDFKESMNGLHKSDSESLAGYSTYTFQGNHTNFVLQFSPDNEDMIFTLILSYTRVSKFKLF